MRRATPVSADSQSLSPGRVVCLGSTPETRRGDSQAEMEGGRGIWNRSKKRVAVSSLPFRLSLSEGMREWRKGPLNHLSNADVDFTNHPR